MVAAWVGQVVLLALVVSAVWHWRQCNQRRKKTLVLIERAGEALLQQSEVPDQQVEVLASSVDFSWLVVLRWREMGHTKVTSFACCRYDTSPEQWRALRRYLRRVHEFKAI